MAGFFAKFYLFAAAYAGRAGMAGGAGAAELGHLPVLLHLRDRQMYLVPPKDEEPIRFPAPAVVSLALAVVGVLALGILSDPFVAFAQSAAAGLMK